MAKGKGNKENHISLLVLPEGDNELYFWYSGNPFRLEDRKIAVVAMDNQIFQTGPAEQDTLEMARAIYRCSADIGFLIAKESFMVVRTPAGRWSSITHEVLGFFPSHKSVLHRVEDDSGKIASSSINKRLNRVRKAEGRFATKNLPDISLHLPVQYPELMPDGAIDAMRLSEVVEDLEIAAPNLEN